MEQKLVSGWDDPRMPTVEGLKRRGIIPETITRIHAAGGVHQVGARVRLEHPALAVNRKLLDPVSRRIFFVPDPVKLRSGRPCAKATIPFHPRTTWASGPSRPRASSLAAGDLRGLPTGRAFSLMDLYNVELTSRGATAAGKYAGDDIIPRTRGSSSG